MLLLFLFFFFSCRRRHTRCLSDWSSDVCSSDLGCPTEIGESLYLTNGTTCSWTAFRRLSGSLAELPPTWDRLPQTSGRRISTPRASSIGTAAACQPTIPERHARRLASRQGATRTLAIASPDSPFFRRTSVSAMAATPTSTTPT